MVSHGFHYIILPGLVFLIVFINLFTLTITLKRRALRRPSNYPIVSFTLAALLQGLVAIPAYLVKKLSEETTYDVAWACDVFRFHYFYCAHVMNLTLLIGCLDRLIAIRRPLHYQRVMLPRRMTTALLLVWSLMLAVDLLPFTNGTRQHSCHYQPTRQWSLGVISATILLPFLVIVCVYSWIWCTALRQWRCLQTQCSTDLLNGSRSASAKRRMIFNIELKATKTSCLIVGSFFICWAPIGVYYLIDNASERGILSGSNEAVKVGASYAVKIISFLSSVITPLIYCWRSREYKTQFKDMTSPRKQHTKRTRLSSAFGLTLIAGDPRQDRLNNARNMSGAESPQIISVVM